jgi:hypothetical protein
LPILANFQTLLFLHHQCLITRIKDREGRRWYLLSLMIKVLALLKIIGVKTRKKANLYAANLSCGRGHFESYWSRS